MKKLLSSLLASTLLLSQHSMVFASEFTVVQEETPLIEQSAHTLASSESDFEINNGIITKYVGSGGDVVIPDYINRQLVTGIGASAFWNIDTITSVVLPQGLTSIGAHAFSNCTKLETIEIPSKVSSIGENAFFFCRRLRSIVIPSGVTTIPNNAFAYCYSLSSVDLPENLISIGLLAFAYTNLSTIEIPHSVSFIGGAAFSRCLELTSIVIPPKVTEILGSTFSECKALTSIVIPEGVTSIGTAAFTSCESLKTIELPSTLKTIGFYGFSTADNMTDIYFKGTEAQWNEIKPTNNDGSLLTSDNADLIAKYQEMLSHVNVHFTSNTTESTPSVSTTKIATPSTAKVMVNGTEVPFGAYNIDGYNYFKLTDISFSIFGTAKQFRVSWDADKNAINMLLGEEHSVLGTEMQGNSGKNELADLFTSPIYCNGAQVKPTVYVIDGSSYFQLASLVEIIGITVGWDGDTSTITIST